MSSEKNTDGDTQGVFSASTTIIATTLGGAIGVFGIVEAVAETKIFGFIFLSLLTMIVSYISVEFLCISSEISKNYSFQNLSYSYFGANKGSLLTRCFIIFGNWAIVLIIIQTFADFMPNAMAQLFEINSNSFVVSRWFSVLIGLIIIFPWIVVKDIHNLKTISVVSLLFGIVATIILASSAIKAISLNEIASVEIATFDAFSIFKGLSSMAWCWCFQYNVLPIYVTLRSDQRPQKIQKVAWISMIVIFIYYFINGFAAYLVWGNDINEDFITNLDPENTNYIFYFKKWLALLIQLFMCIATFISQPLYTIEARINLHSVLIEMYRKFVPFDANASVQEKSFTVDDNDDDENEKHSDDPLIEPKNNINNNNMIEDKLYEETLKSRICEGSFLVLSAALIAIFVTNVNAVIALSGAIYSAYISYFLPAFIYYRVITTIQRNVTRKQLILKYLAILMIIYSVIVFIFGTISVFV